MKLSLEQLKELLPGFHLDHRGKNLMGPCLQCGHSEFGISIEEGHKFGCYRKAKCGFNGNIVVLLRFLGKYEEYENEKSTTLPGKIEAIAQFIAEVEREELPTIFPPIGWKRIFQHPYLDERGFTKEDYENYPVGTTSVDSRLRKDYVIFLCNQDGSLKGWVARHRATKDELEKINFIRKGQGKTFMPRYRNSTSDFESICYGLDELNSQTERLIIVEGIFDKINTDRQLKLRSKEKQKCLCTFKAGVSDSQLKLIQSHAPNLKEIVLLYDSDVVKIIKETCTRLAKFYEVKVGYHSSKDPGEMEESDFFEVFSNLSLPIEFKTFKLEVNKLK